MSGGNSLQQAFADEQLSELRFRLEAAVRRACPTWLAANRDDIVQIALLRVSRAVPTEGKDAVPASYLWKAAHSATIDEIRRARRANESGLDSLGPEAPSAEVSPERQAASRLMGDAIRACLAVLPQDRRLSVTLHLQGHTVPECGRLLGWNAKRAENLVYRGLESLRGCLKSKGFAP